MSKYHYYMLFASFFSFQLFIHAAAFEWDNCFDNSQAEELPEEDWYWDFPMDEDKFGEISRNSESLEIEIPPISNNCALNEEAIVLAPNNHTAPALKRPKSWHVAENKIFYLDGLIRGIFVVQLRNIHHLLLATSC